MTLVVDVLRQAHGISHAAHLVLLAITAYVEEHGAPVYPSQATLATDSGVTERYIEACVQECEAAGYLQVERRRVAGKRPRNFYTVSLLGQTIPEARSGKHVRGTGFPEAPSVEKKERKDLQEHRDRGTHIPEPTSPNPVHPCEDEDGIAARLTPGGQHYAELLARSQIVTPDFAQTTMRGTQDPPLPPPEGVTTVHPPVREKKSRAPALYFQGKLCPRGHDDGTGHTLRRVSNGNCTECDVERTRAKRQAAAAAREQAPKPARQVIDLAAHRLSQGG